MLFRSVEFRFLCNEFSFGDVGIFEFLFDRIFIVNYNFGENIKLKLRIGGSFVFIKGLFCYGI